MGALACKSGSELGRKGNIGLFNQVFEDHGFRPVPFASIPGFYVDVGNGSPKIGLRADMDALLQEVNGQLQPNHSCGHDAHMAIVTAVMLRLKK